MVKLALIHQQENDYEVTLLYLTLAWDGSNCSTLDETMERLSPDAIDSIYRDCREVDVMAFDKPANAKKSSNIQVTTVSKTKG